MIERITVRETNCYLLRGEAGAVIVDPGPPGSGPAIAAGAARVGLEPADVRLIFVTHGHLDHYGAAPEVKAWCGAPVSAYPGEPEFSREPRNALPPAQTLRGSLVRLVYLLFASRLDFRPLAADILLPEGADLSAYGLAGETLLLPGHSPGSLGIVTAEGDALVGDLLVNYTVPSKPLYLMDGLAWQQSCDRLRARQPRTVYVGHGEPFAGTALDHIYPARYQMRWWVR